MGDNDIISLIRSGWPQLLGVFAVIWWSRKIDLKTRDHCERLDRHEERLRGLEQSHQAQALAQARVEESLSGIKLTLDRIYAALYERS